MKRRGFLTALFGFAAAPLLAKVKEPVQHFFFRFTVKEKIGMTVYNPRAIKRCTFKHHKCADNKERTLTSTDKGVIDENGTVVTKEAVHIYDAEGNCLDDIGIVFTEINLDAGTARCMIFDGHFPPTDKVAAHDAFLKVYNKHIHIIERSTYFQIHKKEMTLLPSKDTLDIFYATIHLKAPLTYKVRK